VHLKSREQDRGGGGGDGGGGGGGFAEEPQSRMAVELAVVIEERRLQVIQGDTQI